MQQPGLWAALLGTAGGIVSYGVYMAALAPPPFVTYGYGCRVGDLVDAGHEMVARVLLPVGRAEGELPWSHFVPREALTATTSWYDLLVSLGASPKGETIPPYAEMTRLLNTALEKALARILGPGERCWWVLWAGYGGLEVLEKSGFNEAPALLRDLPQDVIEQIAFAPARKLADYAVLRHEPASWLLAPDGEPPHLSHYPLLACSDSLSVVLACPAYHDSVYLSGPRVLLEELSFAGIEIFEIAPDLVLPGSGEIFG